MPELATKSLPDIETVNTPVKPSVIPLRTEASNIPSGSSERDPQLQLQLNLIKNEFNSPPQVSFEPLIPSFKDAWRQKYFDGVRDVIKDDFEYLAITSGIEIASPRIDFLQDLTKKLLGDNKRGIQIVIQTKGLAKNAFTYPDGTIVVTQALINEANSVDELASIIGHEIGHLVLETSYRASTSGGHLTPGITWVHEEGCDAYGMKLVEDAGYNSLAFSNIIQRVSGHGRGQSHQTGEARASYSYGGHMVIDSKTSNVPETPLPTYLKEGLQKTNLEMVTEIWDTLPLDTIQPLLAKLHPRDLLEVIKMHNKKYSYDRDKSAVLEAVKDQTKEFILDRVTELGFTQADGVALLGFISGSSFVYKDVITTPDMVNDITNLIPNLNNHWLDNISKTVFKSNMSTTGLINLTFLNYLNENYFDINNPQSAGTMPVDEDSFLNFIAVCDTSKYINQHYDSEGTLILQLLDDYSTNQIESNPKLTTFEEKIPFIKNFLLKAKGKNIHINELNLQQEYKKASDERKVKLELFAEVFNLKTQEDGPQAIIDRVFQRSERRHEPIVSLDEIIRELQNMYEKIPEEDIPKYVSYIYEKIKPSLNGTTYSVQEYLNGNSDFDSNKPMSDQEKEQNISYQKFSYGIAIARSMFNSDTDEYYDFLNKLTTETNIDFSSLNFTQLINLANNLISFNSDSNYAIELFDQTHVTSLAPNNFGVRHYDKLQKHPLFQSLNKAGNTSLQAASISELREQISIQVKGIRCIRYGNPMPFQDKTYSEYNIFSDSALNLYFNNQIVQCLEGIIQQDIPPQEFGNVYTFVSEFFPSNPQRNQLLRDINLYYLNSSEIDLNQKIDYLIENSDRVGPEGIIILGEQIENIEDYRNFKKRLGPRLENYLNGSKELSAIATTDYATSRFIDNMQNLFETCMDDPYSQKKQSTAFAQRWLNSTLNGNSSFAPKDYGVNSDLITFDPHTLVFTVNDRARQSFKSVHDLFENIHSLSHLQRIGIIHKLLTDSKGALTNEQGRKKLSQELIQALNLPDGLVKEALIQSCLDVDAKLIALPTANMLSPLLGRSLQVEAIDLESLKEVSYSSDTQKSIKLGDNLSTQQVKYLINSPTQQITQFGLGYHSDPNSPLFRLSSHSDRVYDQSLSTLQTIVRSSYETSNKPQTETSSEINPGLEAIIKGIESSGALGIRALQLAVQFYQFPPEMHKRLSSAFDSVPALSKVFFWENLDRLCNDSSDTEALIQRATVKKCLGGGSLQTTYEAHFKEPDDTITVGTLKMKNPNVAARLKDTYTAAKTVLDHVAENSRDEAIKQQARVASMLIDLSQNWCLADINDKTFEIDDDNFQQTIDKYNQTAGFGAVYAPDRIFTAEKLTSEKLVTGRTVNQILNDEAVDGKTKQDLVWTMTEFFLYQLKEPVTLPDGNKEYLIHSDPHVGNIIADLSGEDIKMGVIDRSLFIKMNEKEASLIRKMIDGSNISDFTYSTIDYLLSHNKIGGIQKGLITSQIFGKLASEFTKQFARGNVDKISLLNTLFMELNKSQGDSFDIPLNFRLMIRNVAASQELTRRHDLNLEEIARSTQFIT